MGLSKDLTNINFLLTTCPTEHTTSPQCTLQSITSFSRKLAKLAGVTPPPLLPSPHLPSPHLPSPHLPPSPPPCLPPIFPPSLLPPPSSQVRLRPVVALWHAVSVAYLAAALAHSHSHSLTVSLSLSHLSHLSHLFLISLISLSSLSLSLLSVSRLSVSLLSLLSQEDPGKEPHIKDSSPLPPKRAPCFFLPRCPPLSHSGALAFAPPLASSECFDIFPNRLCLRLPAYVSFLWGCLFQRWQLVFQAKLLPYPALQSLPTPWPRCQDIRDFGWHYFKLREFGIP